MEVIRGPYFIAGNSIGKWRGTHNSRFHSTHTIRLPYKHIHSDRGQSRSFPFLSVKMYLCPRIWCLCALCLTWDGMDPAYICSSVH